jgi:hypothetical protein
MQRQPTAKFISATVLVSAIGLSLGIGQASGAEVALVESVSGRVVAFAAGKQSRPRESEQGDKWSFCLTAGTLCPANQERQ